MTASTAKTPTVTEVDLPYALRAVSRLARVDYCDAHRVTGSTGAGASPEAWLREMLENAPTWLRIGLPPGWSLLGLRHGAPRSPQYVLGWPIQESTPDRIVLAAQSRVGMPAELVLARDGEDWVFATLIEHDNAAVARLWRGIAGAHRQIVRHLLRAAAQRTARA